MMIVMHKNSYIILVFVVRPLSWRLYTPYGLFMLVCVLHVPNQVIACCKPCIHDWIENVLVIKY